MKPEHPTKPGDNDHFLFVYFLLFIFLKLVSHFNISSHRLSSFLLEPELSLELGLSLEPELSLELGFLLEPELSLELGLTLELG